MGERSHGFLGLGVAQCNFAIPQIVVTMFLLIGAEVVGVTFAFTYRDNVSDFLF